MCHTYLCNTNTQCVRSVFCLFGVITDGLLFGYSAINVQVPSFCVVPPAKKKFLTLFTLNL